jgi:hypothetical protein
MKGKAIVLIPACCPGCAHKFDAQRSVWIAGWTVSLRNGKKLDIRINPMTDEQEGYGKQQPESTQPTSAPVTRVEFAPSTRPPETKPESLFKR